jgi:hypothetical protein
VCQLIKAEALLLLAAMLGWLLNEGEDLEPRSIAVAPDAAIRLEQPDQQQFLCRAEDQNE